MTAKTFLNGSELLALVDGKLQNSAKPEELLLLGLTALDDWQEGFLSFVADAKLIELAIQKAEKLSAPAYLLVEERLLPSLKEKKIGTNAILFSSEKVKLQLAKLSAHYFNFRHRDIQHVLDGRKAGNANIHPDSWIAPDVFIGEHVVIEQGVRLHSGVVISSHCVIKAESELFPNVTLYPFSEIGAKCRIHSGTVIGSDGFGYEFDQTQGIHVKIHHSGSVRIGDHVEIGANSTIDRGTFGITEIGPHCIIDNQVQIGHNCKLGKGVVLCGQVGLAGSAKLGHYCVLGGKAGIGPGVILGDGVQVAGNAMVTHNWPAGSQIAGHPARPVKEWLRTMAKINRLT
jgi:UDP-3-O-[3-hydroxymyristoyl] glucosamine N-acyltransferase